jgi:hypothetical protein
MTARTILTKDQVAKITQNLDLSAAGAGHFVIIAVDGNVAVFVDRPFQQLVRRREVTGQRGQKLPFVFEGWAGMRPALPWGRCSIRTVDHSRAWRLRSSRLAKVRPG